MKKYHSFGKSAMTALFVTLLVGATFGCSDDSAEDELILQSIAVTSPPTKTVYVKGDALDLSGLVVTGTYANGTTKQETVGIADISGYDATTTGTKTLTVTVSGKTATFTVTVNDTALQSIAVTSPPTKTVYALGETLNISGLVVTGTYADDTTKVESVSLSNISGYNANTVGQQTLTVTVNGETATFTVTVSEPLDGLDGLANAPGGDTATNPVLVAMKDSLANGGWEAILSAIAEADKYVSLDLSVCTMDGTEFDPGTGTGAEKITALILPDTAQSIKAGTSDNPTFKAFTALRSISGMDVKTVGDYAFYWCNRLTSVSLPVATSIGDYAFHDCYSLASVSLPVATTIGDRAFSSCYDLTSVSLPVATSIGDYAFSSCTRLASVSLPATPPSISSIFSFTGYDGVTTIKGTITIIVPVGAISAYTSAWGVDANTPAGGNTGVYGDNHKAVRITDPTGGSAVDPLSGLDGLANAPGGNTASDPVSLTLSGVFTNDSWGATLSVIAASGKYTALDLAACTMPNTEFHPGFGAGADRITALILPDAARSVAAGTEGNPTFKDLTALTSLSGAGVEAIGDLAFFYCESLASVSLPVVVTIGDRAFCRTGLIEVSLPKAVTIGIGGDYAFGNCTSLTTVNLPVAVTISGYTFVGCTSLTEVNLPAATTIGDFAFSAYRFSDMSLTTVNLPVAITIGAGAFYGCTNLTSVSLPVATDIGGFAFQECASLESVSLPVAQTIGERVFRGCTSLTEVNLPVATTIGGDAFMYCASLTSVDLPVVETIGSEAFSGCTALTTITVNPANTAYTAHDGMLLNKAETTLIAYPSASGAITLLSVTEIGTQAFSGASLTSVSLPAATTIGEWAFYQCTSLTEVILPATPPSIGGYTFAYTGYNSSGTITVRVPTGAVSAYTSAWGVDAETPAGNDYVYGYSHKAVLITDAAQ